MKIYSSWIESHPIARLFEPATVMMVKLNFTQKSVFLSLIVVISFASIASSLYLHLNDNIHTAKQELIGIKLLPHLIVTTQLVQQHRGLSAGVLGGTKKFSSARHALLDKISRSFDLLEGSLSETMTEKNNWHEIKRRWIMIVEHGMTWSTKANFEAHTQLVSKLHLFSLTISDTYSLANQPHLDSYYLFNTALNQLMPAQELLGQVRALGTSILARKRVSEVQKLHLNTLLAQANASIEGLKRGLKQSANYNDELKSSLLNTSYLIVANLELINELVQDAIISDHFITEPKEFFDITTSTIDSSYNTLLQAIIPTAQKLTEKHIYSEEKVLYSSAILIAIALLAIMYFAMGILIAIIRNMKLISNTTLAFAEGDFSKRIELNAINELLPLGISFNAMAETLETLIHDEKRDKARIKAIINSSQDALIQIDATDKIIGWSHQAQDVFGWSADEVMGESLHLLIIPLEFRKQHLQGISHFLTSGKGPIIGKIIEISALHHDGHEFPIELTVTPLEADGKYEFNAFVRDISERKKIEDGLQLSARVFNVTHEGIIITDERGIIIDVNPAFSHITGYSSDEVIGKNPNILSSGKQSPAFYTALWREVNNSGVWQGEVWNRKKDGQLYAESLTVSALKDDSGKTVHYVGLFSDITRHKEQQEKLSLMAHYDVLTQLPNRALFSDRFSQAIAHSKRSKTQLAICFIDLDDFKPINDNFGHDVGDQLLIKVANRIKARIREEDTVSRQGGDEFALIIGDVNSVSECEHTLQRIHESLAEPYLIDELVLNITASIGITMYPYDSADIDTLLRHADQAMYQSKQSGRNRYTFFNAQQDLEDTNKQLQFKEIQYALSNDQLQLYFQPKVNMASGDVFGAEALIRWNHPEKGLIPPLQFLPLVEGTELEIKVGNWVVLEALEQIFNWQEKGIKLEVSINISSHHLLYSGFFEQLSHALSLYPSVDSSQLQLEILESSSLSNLDAINVMIKSCKNELGVASALDDFGTGYSSLTHLRNLAADTIKIDQSFIRDLLDDPDDAAIIDGVIGLANAFNRKVIAEGVEETDHGSMLLLMGCKDVQGYGISRPMPAQDFESWLINYTPNQEWLIYGKKDLSTTENKLQQFKLTSKRWLSRFISNLDVANETKNWPIKDHNRCHCGNWLHRTKQEQLFNQKKLHQLEIVHDNLHEYAHKLFAKYQQNDLGDLQSEVRKLHSLFDDMILLLESM